MSLARGEYKEAYEHFMEALKILPNNNAVWTLHLLGFALNNDT